MWFGGGLGCFGVAWVFFGLVCGVSMDRTTVLLTVK